MDHRTQRRLAAILAIDVAGYGRLIGRDEVGTIEALNSLRAEVIDPLIGRNNGRTFKNTGDGLLAEFSSAVDAVLCAVSIQQAASKHSRETPAERRMELRIGVNVGDIVVDKGDVFGDGVVIAVRLEAICERGGVCISGATNDQIGNRLPFTFRDLGARELKHVDAPMKVYGLAPGEIAAVRLESSPAPDAPAGSFAAGIEPGAQQVRFCTSSDGVNIAYATVGSGPPLVKSPNWLTHLEYEWESPVWRHLIREFSSYRTLVRFDQRANGLSDWDVENVSFEAFVDDLEAVTGAMDLERFSLIGISQGCAIAVAYAVRHPDRVSKLVLCAGFVRGGARRGPVDAEKSEAFNTLIRLGWGQDNPAFRQLYTSNLIPGGTREQMDWYNDLMRLSASPENALRLRESFSSIDISNLLPKVVAPTLVLHARGDAVAPFAEGRELAANIPNARFVALESDNHILLEDEPAWPRFVNEVRSFLGSSV